MSEKTYNPRNRDVILNRANDYYENDKKKIKRASKNKYRNLSEEEKNKKREYGKKQISQYVSRKETTIKRISKKLSCGKKILL